MDSTLDSRVSLSIGYKRFVSLRVLPLGFEFMIFAVPVALMSTWAVWIPAEANIYCLLAPPRHAHG